MKFIIVEDDENYQVVYKKIIRKCVNQPFKIESFKNYNSLLQKEIDDTSERKVYLLDIKLEKIISGIDIALKIRQHDWDSEIIFLTGHKSYFETVYKNIYKVFGFIEKTSDMNTQLSKIIKDIMNKKYDVKMFKYHNSQIDLQIYLKDILYIYRDTYERKLVIVTTHSKFLINKNIADILSNLDSRFIQTHRSCIVNNDHVCVYNWNRGSFILDNKQEIFLLSKHYKKVVSEILT